MREQCDRGTHPGEPPPNRQNIPGRRCRPLMNHRGFRLKIRLFPANRVGGRDLVLPPTSHTTAYTVRHRWFNRNNTETRTGPRYCSIRPVRVFHWRWPSAHWHGAHFSNKPFGNRQPHKPAIPEIPISSGSSPVSSVSSITSRYTSGDDGAAIRPIHSSCSAFSQL